MSRESFAWGKKFSSVKKRFNGGLFHDAPGMGSEEDFSGWLPFYPAWLFDSWVSASA